MPGWDYGGTQPQETSDPFGVTSDTATEPPPEKQPSKNPLSILGRAIGGTASALAYPFVHPMGFVSGVSNEVNSALADVASLGGAAPNPVSEWLAKAQIKPKEGRGVPRFENAPAFDVSQVQTPADVPVVRMLPFMQTQKAVYDPEMRRQLLEHPEQVGIDVASLFGGAEGTRLAAASGKLGEVASKAGELASRVSPELVTKTAEKLGPVASYFPSKRTPETAVFPQALRAAEQEATHAVGPLQEALRGVDETVLAKHLTEGRRPEDPALAAAYDAVEGFSKADALNKTTRDVGEATKRMLAQEAEASQITGRPALERQLGKDIADELIDRFHSGVVENPETGFVSLASKTPIPGTEKAWNALNKDYQTRLLRQRRNMRLYEIADPQGRTQLYPWGQYRKLNVVNKLAEKGKITPEQALSAWSKEVPGRFSSLMEAQTAAKAESLEKLRLVKGYGPKAHQTYSNLVDDAMGTWLDLQARGHNPVYIPSKALGSPIEEVLPRSRLTTRTPGSLKQSGGVARFGKEQTPSVMFDLDQRALAAQEMTQKAVSEVYRSTGGMPYEEALKRYQEAYGLSEEQAHRMVQARKRTISLDGSTSKAAPGSLVVDADIGRAMDHYFKAQMPGLGSRIAQKGLHAWTVPILWLSPRFHINNILGGAALTALKEGPQALLRWSKDAYEMAKSGEMDYHISGGAISAPSYEKATSRFSKKVEQGTRLANLWTSLHPGNLVDASRRFNQFMDSFYRSVTYLNEYDRSLRKGALDAVARESAWKAASNVLQNWDMYSPIEKSVLQNLIPFVSWQKTVLRTVMNVPVDHPFRVHVLAQLARDDQDMRSLPEDWKAKLALTNPDASGKQYWLSTKGMNPFAGAGDILTLKGFLGSLTPYASIPLQGFGVSPYEGGVPYFGGTAGVVDPATGAIVHGFDTSKLLGLVPQLQALVQGAGLMRIPPPKDPTPKGVLDWLDRYGSKLGLMPGLSYDSIQKAQQRLRENISRADESQAAEQRKHQAPTPVGTSAPSGNPFL